MNTPKINQLSKELSLPDYVVAMVLYNYLAICCQEIITEGSSHTVFGEMRLNDNDILELVPSKFGLIDLLNKKDIKIIRKIVEMGPDTKIFGV